MTTFVTRAPLDSPATVLDAAALARLRELDPEGRAGVVPRVMRTFEHSLAKTLAALRQAAESRDLAELRRLAHTLKSSSASIGAMELSAACARLESLARDRLGAQIPEALVQLLTAGTQAQAAVSALLASPEKSPRIG